MTPPLQFPVQLIESLGDGDLRSVRHHHARRQHPSHQGQQPPIGDRLGNPVEQGLMMDPVENFDRSKFTTL
jgi:hypothetical protein